MDDIVKIQSSDYATKGISPLPDVPEMTAAALKRKFDEIALDLLIPKINEVIERANDLRTIAEQSGQVSYEQIQSWTAAALLAATALQPADLNTLTALTEVLTHNNAGSHNSIYRGKSLGSSVTAAQYDAISDGTFAGLYIGDYWTINEVSWRIAAFDYWYGAGDTACTTHHALIVPDAAIASNIAMNSTNITTMDPSTTTWKISI